MNGQGERRFHSPRDYLELARSAAATPDDLRRLAGAPWNFVLEAVARHPSTPTDVLDRLLPDKPEDIGALGVMCAVAAHPSASRTTLAAIAKQVPRLLHERPYAQWAFETGVALFANPSAPDDALLDLLADTRTTTQFRKVAARETNHPAALDRLMRDASETVRRAAQRAGSSPS